MRRYLAGFFLSAALLAPGGSAVMRELAWAPIPGSRTLRPRGAVRKLRREDQ